MKKAFTLIELLVVTGVIGVLSSIVIVAVNPDQQLTDARNAKRRAHVHALQKAVEQYLIDDNTLSGIPSGAGNAKDICQMTLTGSSCTSAGTGVDLSVLTGSYIVQIPVDPEEGGNRITAYGIYAVGDFYKICSPILDSTCGSTSPSGSTSSVASSSSPASPTVTSGLVAYWDFEEGTGTSADDESSNSYVGTLENMESGDWVSDTPTTTFTNNYGLNFDGSDEYVDITGLPLSSFPVSVSVWFKTTSSTAATRTIVSFADTASISNYYSLHMDLDDKIRWQVRGSTFTVTPKVISSSALNDGNWHHAVGISTANNNHELYIDGVSQGTSTDATVVTDPVPNNVAIGAWHRSDGIITYFPGTIDEVRVYNRALTSQEISDIYDGDG